MATADLLRLTQILGPAFPIGAFTHSQGLEAAIAQGSVTDAPSLLDWTRVTLSHGTGRLDAAFLVAARQEDADLAPLAETYAALMPSAGRDLESRELGRGFTMLAHAVGLDIPAGLPLPLAVGVATRQIPCPTEDVVALWLQSLAAQLVSVAVRFVPLGQSEGQSVLARLAPLIASLAERAATGAEDGFHAFTPGADLASMSQEHLETRIFRS